MMVRCSTGVSPAIFPISTQRKNAGETPAPRKPAFHRELDELYFAGRIWRKQCAVEQFDFAFAAVAYLCCPAYAMIRLEIQREL